MNWHGVFAGLAMIVVGGSATFVSCAFNAQTPAPPGPIPVLAGALLALAGLIVAIKFL